MGFCDFLVLFCVSRWHFILGPMIEQMKLHDIHKNNWGCYKINITRSCFYLQQFVRDIKYWPNCLISLYPRSTFNIEWNINQVPPILSFDLYWVLTFLAKYIPSAKYIRPSIDYLWNIICWHLQIYKKTLLLSTVFHGSN